MHGTPIITRHCTMLRIQKGIKYESGSAKAWEDVTNMPGEIKTCFVGRKKDICLGSRRWTSDEEGIAVRGPDDIPGGREGGKCENTWQASFEAGVFGKRCGWHGMLRSGCDEPWSFYWDAYFVGKGESHHFVSVNYKIVHISCSDLISSST